MKTFQKVIVPVFLGLLLMTVSTSFVAGQAKPKGKEWKVPDADAKKKSTITVDAEALKAAKETWSQQCKSCHGAKGLGDGTKAEKIEISCGDFSSAEVQNLSDGALYWKITEGRKPMPSYAEKLSDTERWQLVAFMRTLKKGGAVTTSTTTTTTVTTKTTDAVSSKKEEPVVKKEEVKTITVVDTVSGPGSDSTITIPRVQFDQMKARLEQMQKDLEELNATLKEMVK